ncbi:FG-GAP repeat domain-containing protein [Paenarthrobacter sp. NPDC058040]|uniref:FG-GAP repeat domain-containing protein n=1 Tax=unclassified Paenarthrobacter TaxID=2634190 RepID=UPI0036DDA1FC
MGSSPRRRARTWLAGLTASIALIGGLGFAPAAYADDTFAPVPVAVSTTPESIGSGGQATSRVTFETSSPISNFYVFFRNTITGEWHRGLTQGSFNQADSTYSFNVVFPQPGTAPGTYRAEFLQFSNAAGQEFGYLRDGSLVHNPGAAPASGTAAVSLAGLDFNYNTPFDIDRPHTSGFYRPYLLATPYNMSLFVRLSDGRLGLYPTGGNATWLQAGQVGSGWQIFNTMFAAGDFNGDGENDVITRDNAGSLFLYPANGQGGWYPRQQIGWGWGIFSSIFAAGDFNGDGHNDLLARKANGELVLYPGNGHGGFLASSTVGWGWNGMTSIFSPGDFDGDHKPDVLARDSAGNLVFYGGNGLGGWTTSRVIGQGWNAITKLGGAGDFDGDGANDVWGIDTSGQMRMYYGNGSGGWKSFGVVGWGWGGFNAVF